MRERKRKQEGLAGRGIVEYYVIIIYFIHLFWGEGERDREKFEM